MRNIVRDLPVAVTLTYPRGFPHDGKIVKGHLFLFLQFLRNRNIEYFWVKEFQVNRIDGVAPHFHILISKPLLKDLLSRKWFNIVASGDVRHLNAGTRIEFVRNQGGLVNYMMKTYLQKNLRKEVPDDYISVGRFWGYSRSIIRKFIEDIGFYDLKGRIVETSKDIYWEKCFLRSMRRWYIKKIKLEKWKYCPGWLVNIVKDVRGVRHVWDGACFYT